MAAYIGKWRITEMEMWDREFIDMEAQGHVRRAVTSDLPVRGRWATRSTS